MDGLLLQKGKFWISALMTPHKGFFDLLIGREKQELQRKTLLCHVSCFKPYKSNASWKG